MTDVGLGEDWEKLMQDLDEIVPYYEEGNSVMSFGTDVGLRRELLQKGMPEAGVFLDVGSGPGNMSAIAREVRPEAEGVLLDPLPRMLKRAAEERGETSFSFVCGVFEWLPFREGGFAACTAGFTIRDARDRTKAYQDIAFALKPGGVFLLIDLAKPDSRVKRAMVTTYWRAIAPVLLRMRLGSRWRYFADIYLTYRHLPPNKVFLEQLGQVFATVEGEKRMLDGVLMVKAAKAAAAPDETALRPSS
ncbi:MAG: class I SAM-dependent methyltransferase [Nitrososphaerota archaeon]|nr:class I SAM-dependent methyltransferase [Nitrososphaerota archaeon]MDG6940309.1 class I SAM-dependent methyltransferase [Nitrososphaerota archaeon]